MHLPRTGFEEFICGCRTLFAEALADLILYRTHICVVSMLHCLGRSMFNFGLARRFSIPASRNLCSRGLPLCLGLFPSATGVGKFNALSDFIHVCGGEATCSCEEVMIARTDNGFQRPTCASGGNMMDQGVWPGPDTLSASGTGTNSRRFSVVAAVCTASA